MERAAYLAATLALTAFGQFVIKARSLSHAGGSGGRPSAYVLAMVTDAAVLSGLAAALLASLCWTLAIQKTPLSVAYPFMALSFVIVPFGSAWLFGDRLSLGQMGGCLLIVIGVSVSAFVR